MPNTSRIRTGRTMASSTAAAPRSVRRREERDRIVGSWRRREETERTPAPEQSGRRGHSTVYGRALLILVKAVLILPPSAATTVTMTAAMRATIMPYSTAVAPCSSSLRFWRRVQNASTMSLIEVLPVWLCASAVPALCVQQGVWGRTPAASSSRFGNYEGVSGRWCGEAQPERRAIATAASWLLTPSLARSDLMCDRTVAIGHEATRPRCARRSCPRAGPGGPRTRGRSGAGTERASRPPARGARGDRPASARGRPC